MGPSLRSLGFLGLTLTVFTWGLQYKLSLYDSPHSVSRQIPAAKLLSRNEQTKLSDRSLISIARPVLRRIPVHLILPAIALFFSVQLNRFGETACGEDGPKGSHQQRVRSFASLTAFFFRPPPVAI